MVGLVGSLVLVRKAASARLPAMALCGVVVLSFLPANLFMEDPYAGAHASIMLVPALGVYLLGGRAGFFLSAVFSLMTIFLSPLYYRDSIADLPRYWGVYTFAGLAVMGGWGLGWLSSAAHDGAQAALVRTLGELEESRSRLSSLVESTEDLVLSLDREGRVLVINEAARRAFKQRFGKEGLRPGDSFLGSLSPEARARWEGRVERILAGERQRVEDTIRMADGGYVVMDTFLNPIRGEDGQVKGLTFFMRDVTARKEAEAKLAEMHRTLLDVSRQAGMAEIATGVLHNVGNTLNSVNVSAAMVAERLRGSRVSGLAKAAGMLAEHAGDVGRFLTEDARGRQLPQYFIAAAGQLVEERDALLGELRGLSEGIEHIKSIISMQQAHARLGGVVERLPVPQLVDDAMRLHAISLERLGIQVRREDEPVPPILVDRHKLLQILINLLSNARHALMDGGGEGKVLTLRVKRGEREGWLRIEVEDNGVGIAPENLPRLFTQGFTTRRTGHGFGLHISALAAEDMGGTLTCTSAGPGQGATFALDLPVNGKEDN
jgi:PAS domain S-box-containing protein